MGVVFAACGPKEMPHSSVAPAQHEAGASSPIDASAIDAAVADVGADAGPSAIPIGTGPAKRIYTTYEKAYVLQADGQLIFWQPPSAKLEGWERKPGVVATGVVDFDGVEAVYADGRFAELRASGNLVDVAGPRDQRAVDFDFSSRCTCVVDAKKDARCRYGQEPFGPVVATDVEELRVGADESCALRANGELVCWSRGKSAAVRMRTVRSFDLASDLGCAVHDDGALQCWGERKYVEGPRFVVDDAKAVHVTKLGACAVRASGELKCWGSLTRFERISWLRGARALAMSGGHSCAILADQRAVCWTF